MIDDRPLSSDRVPTLTEVVELDLPVKSPAEAGRVEDAAPSTEAAVDDPAPTLPPEVVLPHVTPAPVVDVAADPVPALMAEDFELSGLEAVGAVTANLEADAAIPVAAAETAQAAVAVETAFAAVAAETADPTASAAADLPAAETPAGPAVTPSVEPQAPVPVVDVDAVVGQVLSELMPRIDMLLESRLREALAPALARAADGLIRDTRANLSVAVRDLVQEAVDRALQRRADR